MLAALCLPRPARTQSVRGIGRFCVPQLFNGPVDSLFGRNDDPFCGRRRSRKLVHYRRPFVSGQRRAMRASLADSALAFVSIIREGGGV